MPYLGELIDGGTHDFYFTTVKSDGVPIVLAGTPVLSIYKDNNLVQTTAGITLTVDFDGVVGLNQVRLVLSDAFYVPDTDYALIITTGTVDGNSVVGYVVAQFSISNRMPTVNVEEWLGSAAPALVGGRLDVSVGAMAAAVLTAAAIAANAITAAKIAADAIGASQIAADAIGASELAADAANEIADALLVRDIDQVEPVTAKHCLYTGILKTVSKVIDDAGTLKTHETDGVTVHMSQVVTTDAANDPIDSLGVGT